jgi:hypothetical protein
MKKQIITLITVSAIIFSACKKETSTTNQGCTITGTARTINDLPADTVIGVNPQTFQGYGANKKTYFSLSTGSIVTGNDTSSLNWDIAFIGTKIYLNNLPGSQAGAFMYNGVYDALCSVPDSTFHIDSTNTNAISGWYSYDQANFIITPKPGKVIIVRTTNGKYAKIEILNYYKGGVNPDPATDTDYHIRTYNSRYYKFRFIYQSNGSTTF